MTAVEAAGARLWVSASRQSLASVLPFLRDGRRGAQKWISLIPREIPALLVRFFGRALHFFASGFGEYGVGEGDDRFVCGGGLGPAPKDFEACDRGQDSDGMGANEPVQFLERFVARVFGDEQLRRNTGQRTIGNDGEPLLGCNLLGKDAERRLIDFEG